MSTCTATGCTARAAARGLCTRHLGLSPTAGTREVQHLPVFVDSPPPRFHVIDTEAARTLPHNPGRWIRYPAGRRWSDWQTLTPRRKAARLNSLATRVRHSRAAYTGFVWEAERRGDDLYIRCIGPDLSITSLKKPA